MKTNISSSYRLNESNKISQGDIFKNFPVYYYDADEKTLNTLKLSYCVVVSQDCDLTQDYNSHNEKIKLLNECNKDENKLKSLNNKLIPSILLVEGFPAEQLRVGEHLSNLGIYTPTISKKTKTPWKNITQNETPRYHYLKEDELFKQSESDIVFDFKRYYTVSRGYLYSLFNEYYHVSLNELYRENLSIRFSNYISRIGLP